jgi:hypothetical protein
MNTAVTPPRTARRPIAVLIALFVGLDALGAVGGAAATTPFSHGHHDDGAGPGPRMRR